MTGDYVYNFKRMKELSDEYLRRKKVMMELQNQINQIYLSTNDSQRGEIASLKSGIEKMADYYGSLGQETLDLCAKLENISMQLEQAIADDLYQKRKH